MKIARFEPGITLDALNTMYPSALHTLANDSISFSESTTSVYGFILSGSAELERKGVTKAQLSPGMYFSSTGPFDLRVQGRAIWIERRGYRGLFTVGGPVEAEGRLCYIDHCQNTVLVPPARLGDPVLNLLVFPPQIQQTMHIHPSIRLGAVFSGRGTCVSAVGKIELEPGSVFLLDSGEPHCFHSGSEKLIVIAYHPESGSGPTDSDNPMLNRTILRG